MRKASGGRARLSGMPSKPRDKSDGGGLIASPSTPRSIPFGTTQFVSFHRLSGTGQAWIYPALTSLSFVMTELSILAALHGPFLQFAILWAFHSFKCSESSQHPVARSHSLPLLPDDRSYPSAKPFIDSNRQLLHVRKLYIMHPAPGIFPELFFSFVIAPSVAS